MMASEYAETCRSVNIIVNKLVVFDLLTCTLCYIHNGDASTQVPVAYLRRRLILKYSQTGPSVYTK